MVSAQRERESMRLNLRNASNHAQPHSEAQKLSCLIAPASTDLSRLYTMSMVEQNRPEQDDDPAVISSLGGRLAASHPLTDRQAEWMADGLFEKVDQRRQSLIDSEDADEGDSGHELE